MHPTNPCFHPVCAQAAKVNIAQAAVAVFAAAAIVVAPAMATEVSAPCQGPRSMMVREASRKQQWSGQMGVLVLQGALGRVRGPGIGAGCKQARWP